MPRLKELRPASEVSEASTVVQCAPAHRNPCQAYKLTPMAVDFMIVFVVSYW